MFTFIIIIITFFFRYFFCITYAIKERAACIVLPYSDGSKAPIQLSGRRRFSLVLVRSRIVVLGTVLKEKLSRLFNPFCIQEQNLYLETWLWLPRKLYVGMDVRDYLNAYNCNFYVCFKLYEVFYSNTISHLAFMSYIKLQLR